MGATTDFRHKKSFRRVEWNPDLLSKARRNVLQWLTMRPMNLQDLITHTCLDPGDVTRLINRMSSEAPPLINRVGMKGLYQLSIEGRKVMQVADVARERITPTSAVITHYAPDPDLAKVLDALKAKPAGIVDLMRLTDLGFYHVKDTLEKLEARGLMATPIRDGSRMLYLLKTTPLEPDKPLLTGSDVPLADEGDWHTWFERMMLHHMGAGKDVVIPEIKSDGALLVKKDDECVRAPKVLLIGWFKGNFPHRIRKHFGARLDLQFIDSDFGGSVTPVARQADYVVVRSDYVSHRLRWSAENAGKPIHYVQGNASRICETMEKILK